MSQQVSETCIHFQPEFRVTSISVYKFSYLLPGHQSFVHSLIKHVLVGPLGTELDTSYTALPHALVEFIMEENGIRNTNNCITILIKAMKKNIEPSIK